MKKYVFFLALTVSAFSCNKEPVLTEPMVITLICEPGFAEEITIFICGTGAVTIDWGDGSENEKYIINPFDRENVSASLIPRFDEYRYERTFSTASSSYAVKIEGENIKHLICAGIGLTDIDISPNNTLIYLNCAANDLTALDISQNIALMELICSNNLLSKLDVSGATDLGLLYCPYNHLETLDVSKNTALATLSCSYNDLSMLDLSNNNKLFSIQCNDNQLTTLDLGNTATIQYLFCENNQLTTLNVSMIVDLAYFDCCNNQLTTLKFGRHRLLQYLVCSYNKLESLDMTNVRESNFFRFSTLSCTSNKLTEEAIYNLLETLPYSSELKQSIYIHDNPGADAFINGDVINGWTIHNVIPVVESSIK